jgi:DNA-binding NarL/FixJ family response regulator
MLLAFNSGGAYPACQPRAAGSPGPSDAFSPYDPSEQETPKLRRLGHLDGRASLDRFHADGPSVVILDLHLPDLSVQRLRKEMKTVAPSIPIIILTTSSDLNEKIILFEMGPID